MSELTDAAKAEIAEAIRIVREDKFEAYVRSRTPQVDPPKKEDEIIVSDDKEKVTPPPQKEKEKEKEIEQSPKRRSAYWGELFDE